MSKTKNKKKEPVQRAPIDEAAPEHPVRFPWPRLRLQEALMLYGLTVGFIALAALLPPTLLMVETRGGLLLLVAAAELLGALAVVLWAADMAWLRGVGPAGRMKMFAVAFVVPLLLMLALLTMSAWPVLGILLLVAAVAGFLFVASHEAGNTGEPRREPVHRDDRNRKTGKKGG